MKFFLILILSFVIIAPFTAYGINDNVEIDGSSQVTIPSEELYRIIVSPSNDSRDVTVKIFGPMGGNGKIITLADYQLSINSGSSYTQFFHKFTPPLYYPGTNYTIEVIGDGLVGRKTVKTIDQAITQVLIPEISFTTNRNSFESGDTFTVSGKVDDHDKSNPYVEIQIIRPDNDSITLSPTPLNSFGNFQKKISASSFWNLNGDYMIKVSHKFTNPQKALTMDFVSSQNEIQFQYLPSPSLIPPQYNADKQQQMKIPEDIKLQGSENSPQTSISRSPSPQTSSPQTSSPQTSSPQTSNSDNSLITGIIIMILFGIVIFFLEKKRRTKKSMGPKKSGPYTPSSVAMPPDPPILNDVQKLPSGQFEVTFTEPVYWGNGQPKFYDVYVSPSKNLSNAIKIHSSNYSTGFITILTNLPISVSSSKTISFFVKSVSTTSESSNSNPIQFTTTSKIKTPKNPKSTRRTKSTTYTSIRKTPKTPQNINSQFRNWKNDASNWPASTDFSDAIQNPKVCFIHPKFSKTKIVPSKIRQGLPFSIEGSFAIVYKVSDGNQFYAVKCFTSPPHGFENQEKLTSFFHKNNLDFVIDYDTNVEIQTISGTYPTLVSSWVKGKTLLEFLEDSSQKNLLKSQAKILAKNFREIVDNMESLKMAHGDLSGKNIMIESNMRIKLIDYDGIYIPEFKNQDVKESGTKHFQHQSRLDGKISLFDETMDRFSALVIYLSLLILSEKPNMFKIYHDESNIIFNQKDLNDPDNSKIFNELSSISNPEIKKLTNQLKRYCKMGLSKIPNLIA